MAHPGPRASRRGGAPLLSVAARNAEACYRAIEGRDARFAGRFFLGVRTTHIYCRPGCPARVPRRENIVLFPSAAAARQAGFRACLRCRPDAAPGTPAQAGTAATLSRALRLLEEQGLIDRRIVSEVPPWVEYSLTDKGADLRRAITGIDRWANRWAPGQ